MAEAAKHCTQHEAPDPKVDPCWKVKKKTPGIKKHFKTTLDKHASNDTIQWFVDKKFANMSTTYNQWADLLWKDLGMHLCVVDSQGVTRQYSTRYWGLKKYNDGWVGFYPSTYKVQQSTDESGGTTEVQVVDLEQLANIPNLKKAEKVYFAGKCYNMVIFQPRRPGDNSMGWRFLGESASEKESIYVRKGKEGYVIINFAMNTNTQRQHYGSRNNAWGWMHDYVEGLFFTVDGEYEDGAFMEEYEDLNGDKWED